MSRLRLHMEICKHLENNNYRFATHFSSWTADLKTAVNFAARGPGSYVGVFDTALRQDHNTILHVPVLYNVGLVDRHNLYPFEYLIYGPVRGAAYTCMSLGSLWPSFPYSDLELILEEILNPCCGVRVTDAVRSYLFASPVVQCCRVAKRQKCYRLHATGADGAWEPLIRDLSLCLTVIASHWSSWFVTTRECLRNWSSAIELAVSGLSWVIWKAAKDPRVVLPLVNSDTYHDDLLRVGFMIKLLQRVEEEIVKVRKRPPWSLFGWSWPQVVGQKRKADDADTPGDSQPSSKRAKA
ncbi:hypothetical protein Daus18300_005718 [Diaporthe australafricana]|uniref:Uncharacterized protein n=1 Tax=Diaporthe australafricana TaxID=127596 RepID=A0ABR3WZH6_9PEZI